MDLSTLDLARHPQTAFRQGARGLSIWACDGLLFVATDRLSAFDCILPDPIPGKGEVLTQLSAFWFAHLRARGSIADHLDHHGFRAVPRTPPALRRATRRPLDDRAPRPAAAGGMRRARLSRRFRLEGIPGHRRGLRPQAAARASNSPTPCPNRSSPPPPRTTTATTKTSTGRRLSSAWATRRWPWRCGRRACSSTRSARSTRPGAGIIIADTKFEFGVDERTGEILLIDEVLTPDSSRFWPANEYRPGISPPSYDKQFVRDYLETLDVGQDPARTRVAAGDHRAHGRKIPAGAV